MIQKAGLLCVFFLLSAGFIFHLSESKGSLILFTQDNSTLITADHSKTLIEVAKSEDLDFHTITPKQGLPLEVKTLPSLFFSNEQGISQYYGRYSNSGRLKTFIRTCKLSHKRPSTQQKKDILHYKSGRADIIAPIKITELSGTLPQNFDSDEFKSLAIKSIQEGMNVFKLKEEFQQEAGTRIFYFSIYPFLNEKGILSLSAEIYSQFNCVKPIFTAFEPPLVTGKWKKREKLFQQAASLLEKEILRLMEESNIGDAFLPVKEETPISTWDELGLSIKVKSEIKEMGQETKTIQHTHWKVEENSEKTDPFLVFSFLSPVDNYAGEVKKLKGELQLNDDYSLKGAKGIFRVNISDVSMGSEDFDHEVQNKMLKMGLFPEATFEFEKVLSVSEPFKINKRVEAQIKGKFNMLGIAYPMEIETIFFPRLDDKGEIIIESSCNFELPLMEVFGVEGPDGPSPSKDILQFFLKVNFIKNK